MMIFRYVSLGSIAAAAVMPVAIKATGGDPIMYRVTIVIALIVIIRHLDNIKRLLAGSENKFKA